MKTIRIAAAALLTALFAGTVAAADFGYRDPYQPAPARGPASLGGYAWTGPYVGLNLGYQWATTRNNPTNPAGAALGIQAGYNWQMMNQFVFGVETDLQMSTADDVFAPWKFSNPWFGTLRGRAGYAMGNVLFYGTVGLAYGNMRAQSTIERHHRHPHPFRLGGRRRRRGGARRSMDGPARISLLQPRQPHLRPDRLRQRPELQPAARRRQLPVLIAGRATGSITRNGPGGALRRPGSCFSGQVPARCRTPPASALDAEYARGELRIDLGKLRRHALAHQPQGLR